MILFVDKSLYKLKDLAVTINYETVIIKNGEHCIKRYKFNLNYFVELIEMVANTGT